MPTMRIKVLTLYAYNIREHYANAVRTHSQATLKYTDIMYISDAPNVCTPCFMLCTYHIHICQHTRTPDTHVPNAMIRTYTANSDMLIHQQQQKNLHHFRRNVLDNLAHSLFLEFMLTRCVCVCCVDGVAGRYVSGG